MLAIRYYWIVDLNLYRSLVLESIEPHFTSNELFNEARMLYQLSRSLPRSFIPTYQLIFVYMLAHKSLGTFEW